MTSFKESRLKVALNDTIKSKLVKYDRPLDKHH